MFVLHSNWVCSDEPDYSQERNEKKGKNYINRFGGRSAKYNHAFTNFSEASPVSQLYLIILIKQMKSKFINMCTSLHSSARQCDWVGGPILCFLSLYDSWCRNDFSFSRFDHTIPKPSWIWDYSVFLFYKVFNNFIRFYNL